MTALDTLPRLSLVHARFEELAPPFVSAGDCELLRDDILALATRMKEAGVEVTLDVAKDMPHNSAVFAQYHPSGEATLQAAAKFAREATSARR